MEKSDVPMGAGTITISQRSKGNHECRTSKRDWQPKCSSTGSWYSCWRFQAVRAHCGGQCDDLHSHLNDPELYWYREYYRWERSPGYRKVWSLRKRRVINLGRQINFVGWDSTLFSWTSICPSWEDSMPRSALGSLKSSITCKMGISTTSVGFLLNSIIVKVF